MPLREYAIYSIITYTDAGVKQVIGILPTTRFETCGRQTLPTHPLGVSPCMFDLDRTSYTKVHSRIGQRTRTIPRARRIETQRCVTVPSELPDFIHSIQVFLEANLLSVTCSLLYNQGRGGRKMAKIIPPVT